MIFGAIGPRPAHARRPATAADRAAVLEEFRHELGHDLSVDERIERTHPHTCPACSTPVNVDDLCPHRAPTCARCCERGHHRGPGLFDPHVCTVAWESSPGPDHTGVLVVTSWCSCGSPVTRDIDSVI